MLGRFNAGRAADFAAAFTVNPKFQPYNGSPDAFTAVSRNRIESFVRTRHRAGDGWTALSVGPPSGGGGSSATYGLWLRVMRGVREPYEQGVKVVVVCSSGRIKTWLGPVGVP